MSGGVAAKPYDSICADRLGRVPPGKASRRARTSITPGGEQHQADYDDEEHSLDLDVDDRSD